MTTSPPRRSEKRGGCGHCCFLRRRLPLGFHDHVANNRLDNVAVYSRRQPIARRGYGYGSA